MGFRILCGYGVYGEAQVWGLGFWVSSVGFGFGGLGVGTVMVGATLSTPVAPDTCRGFQGSTLAKINLTTMVAS